MSQAVSTNKGRPRNLVLELSVLAENGYLISDSTGSEVDPLSLSAEEFDRLLSQHVHLPDRIHWPLADRFLALQLYGKLMGIKEKKHD